MWMVMYHATSRRKADLLHRCSADLDRFYAEGPSVRPHMFSDNDLIGSSTLFD